MNPLFDAVIEAVEEAILNAILASPTMTRARSHRPHAADRPAAGGAGEVRAACYSPVSIRRGLSTVSVVMSASSKPASRSRSANVVTTYA